MMDRPSHSVNKYIFFLSELVENCVFEAVPFKKKPFSTFYTFQAFMPTDSKEELLKALMPSILYLFIFWRESFCNDGVVY